MCVSHRRQIVPQNRTCHRISRFFAVYFPQNMEKDFDGWNDVKKKTNAEEPRLYTVREIWWCRLELNVGSEQDGHGESFLRPVLIVRAFGPNTCLAVPLTASPRRHPLRVPVGKVQDKEASALIS